MKTTNRRKRFCTPVIAAVLLVVSYGAVAGESGKSVTFTFAPKDGTLYLQNLTSTRERVLKNGKKQVEETVATIKVQISKTDSGWEVNTIPIELHMKRDGEEVINPLVRLVTYGERTYKLDTNGKVKDIVGYKSMMKKIRSQFSKKEIQRFKSFLDMDVLKQKDMEEWDDRIGKFLGTTVSLGDKTTGKKPAALPNGTPINYIVNTQYRGMESCAKSKCVRIKQSFDSQAADKSGFQSAPGSQKHKGIASINGNITRLVDPKTMLIYEEVVERKTKHDFDTDKKGTPLKVTEKLVYKYDY